MSANQRPSSKSTIAKNILLLLWRAVNIDHGVVLGWSLDQLNEVLTGKLDHDPPLAEVQQLLHLVIEAEPGLRLLSKFPQENSMFCKK